MGIRGASAELVVAATGLILIGRVLDGPIVWLIAGLLVLAVALGAVQIHGESGAPAAAPGVPVEAVAMPAAAAGAVFAAVHLVPVGVLLAPALV
ncbi:MAG: hypothetical protein HW391_2056, partial [Chloroflexi bacterium]|nr:hypothetical protein [Chloroflexota bacterium]